MDWQDPGEQLLLLFCVIIGFTWLGIHSLREWWKDHECEQCGRHRRSVRFRDDPQIVGLPLYCDPCYRQQLSLANQKCSRFRAKASTLIVAGLFEGEIVRRGQRECKRGMLRSAVQDDTGEQMNLPCRREAEPHAPRPATKFGFQILALA
jgi:hypothetical protein